MLFHDWWRWKMGRSGRFSLGQRRQCVLDEYKALEAIYLSLHGGFALTGHAETEMPPHLRELLPVADGWCFSPIWEAPRPVELWSGQFLALTPSMPIRMPSEAVRELAEIEKGIVQRAITYRLLLHADRLLSQAVSAAPEQARVSRSASPTEAVHSDLDGCGSTGFTRGTSWYVLKSVASEGGAAFIRWCTRCRGR